MNTPPLGPPNRMIAYSALDNFRILKLLGRGSSGKVKLGQDIETGAKFALKILRSDIALKDFETILKLLVNEFHVTAALNHPSILKVHSLSRGVYTSKSKQSSTEVIYAVIELAPGGDLFDLIFYSGGFDENLCRYYFKQVVSALVYLHGQQIAHRDLKPENLLLDERLRLKLTDFGFSTVVNPSKPNVTFLGTRNYTAPEINYRQVYDAKLADVFSAGVVLFVMYSGHPPFDRAHDESAHFKMFVEDNARFWDFHSNFHKKKYYSPQFRQLVNGMLSLAPAERWSLVDVLEKSAWLNEPVDDEGAEARVREIMRGMREVKEQRLARGSCCMGREGCNCTEPDQVHDSLIPKVSFKRVSEPHIQEIIGGVLVRSANKENLAGMVLKKATELGCQQTEAKPGRLTFQAPTGVVFCVNFYQLSAEHFEITIGRLAGDYFKFQRAKKQLVKAIQRGCQEAP